MNFILYLLVIISWATTIGCVPILQAYIIPATFEKPGYFFYVGFNIDPEPPKVNFPANFA
ncbi:uncharacterized protein CELE_C46F9.5 [Caenorhabditis elegans]|uniref:Secreted protein n=1 Tax=Caenorhabditis elegans TaxID=6239 RepID=A0A5S9MNK9_CAEEL|nr:Secreted protein [Caenorhabditis elegans]CAA0059148.1 Secreted protein [Caenorhabditis elegans]